METADKTRELWKKKHFEILCRVDDLCRENGIDTILCADTALDAYRDGSLSDNVSMAIDIRDAYKFIGIIDKLDDLKIRGMHNYHHFSDLEFKVYDPETVDFNLVTFRDYGFCGLYITVKLIKHVPDSSARRLQAIRTRKTYVEYIKSEYDGVEKKSHKRLTLQKLMGRMLPGAKFHARMFKRLVSLNSHKTGTLSIGKIEYPASLFNSKQTVSIMGREFFIPTDADGFFSRRYGEDWREYETYHYEEANYRFRDASYSWEEFRKLIGYLDFETYYSNKDKISDYKKKIRRCNKKFTRDKDLVQRTHLRFVFWQKLMPHKDEIMQLYKNGETEKLMDIMGLYVRQLVEFEEKKLTIFFDREIFDVAKSLLRAKGKAAVADSIEELIPPEHMGPVRIMNYKGEYIS